METTNEIDRPSERTIARRRAWVLSLFSWIWVDRIRFGVDRLVVELGFSRREVEYSRLDRIATVRDARCATFDSIVITDVDGWRVELRSSHGWPIDEIAAALAEHAGPWLHERARERINDGETPEQRDPKRCVGFDGS